MGSYLDKPETTKKSAIDENGYYLVGSSSMQVNLNACWDQETNFLINEINLTYFPTGMAHKSGGK